MAVPSRPREAFRDGDSAEEESNPSRRRPSDERLFSPGPLSWQERGQLLDQWEAPAPEVVSETDAATAETGGCAREAMEFLEEYWDDAPLTRALSALRLFHQMRHDDGVADMAAAVSQLLRASLDDPARALCSSEDLAEESEAAAAGQDAPDLAPPPPPRTHDAAGESMPAPRPHHGTKSYPLSQRGASAPRRTSLAGRFATWSPSTGSSSRRPSAEERRATIARARQTQWVPVLVRAVFEMATETNQTDLKALCAELMMQPVGGLVPHFGSPSILGERSKRSSGLEPHSTRSAAIVKQTPMSGDSIKELAEEPDSDSDAAQLSGEEVCVQCRQLQLQVQAQQLEYQSEVRHLRRSLREAYRALSKADKAALEQPEKPREFVNTRRTSSTADSSTDTAVLDGTDPGASAENLRREVERLQRRLRDEREMWSELLARNTREVVEREEKLRHLLVRALRKNGT